MSQLKITIPKADLAKGIPISQGIHLFTIKDAIARPSKDNQSINYVWILSLDNDVNGREIEHNFNSKAIGMMAPAIAAIANCTVQEILDKMTGGTLEFDFGDTKGKKILGKIYHEDFKGRPMSKVSDWYNPEKVPF